MKKNLALVWKLKLIILILIFLVVLPYAIGCNANERSAEMFKEFINSTGASYEELKQTPYMLKFKLGYYIMLSYVIMTSFLPLFFYPIVKKMFDAIDTGDKMQKSGLIFLLCVALYSLLKLMMEGISEFNIFLAFVSIFIVLLYVEIVRNILMEQNNE